MKIFDLVRNVIFIIAIVVVIAAAGCFLLKIKPAIVQSGSMEPTFHTGSVVFVDRKAADDVKVGDPIAFYVADEYITHRIIDETKTTFITKGDGNSSPDPWQIAKPGQTKEGSPEIDGKCMFSIPILGYVLSFVSSKPGIIVMGSLILCLIFSMFLVPSQGRKEELDEMEKLRSEKEQMQSEMKELEEKLASSENERGLLANQYTQAEMNYDNLYARYMQVLGALKSKNVVSEVFCEKEAARYGRQSPEE